MPKTLRAIEVDEVSLVDAPANPNAKVVLFKRDASETKEAAVWSTAYINDLPDSAFAVIEPGGEKDAEGKTVPRTLRHLPYKDKDGKIDIPHLRNALARLPQTKISDELKAKARRRLLAAAREVGVEVSDDVKKAEEPLRDRLWGFVKGLFAKAEDEAMTFDEARQKHVLKQRWWELEDALHTSLCSILDDESVTDKRAAVQASIEQFSRAVLDLVSQGTAGSPDVSKTGGDAKMPDQKVPDAVEKGAVPEELRKRLEELEKKAAEAEALRKQLEETNKRVEEAEKIAKAEREARERAEIRKRAEAYANAGPVDDIVDILFKAYQRDRAEGEKLEALFKAAHERIAKGDLFKEIGGAGTSSSAEAKILAKVEELRKSQPNLTKEQAYARVIEDNPELYAEYRREVG